MRPRARRTAPLAVGVALLLTAGAGTAAVVRGLDAPAPVPAAAPQRAAVQASAALPALDVALPPLPGASTASPSAPSAPSAPASATPPAPRPAPSVRPLTALRAPDLLVQVPRGLSAAQLRALDAVKGVEALTALDVGQVQVGGKASTVAGVDPSTFRAFTPRETATSDPLWQSVARGELAPSYSLLRSRGLDLGEQLALQGAARVEERIGAVAAFAVPDIELVVSREVAGRLGVTRSTAVLLSAPDRSISRLRRAVLAVTGQGAEVTVLRPVRVAQAAGGRPQSYRELYQRSARLCPGLSWTVLAAIGQIESGHGKNLGPSSAGALGPMQFMPATWASYGVDGDGDGDADTMDPFDAVPAASLYLCRHGANRGQQGLYDAVFAYNHADWYVRKVLALAEAYRAQG